MAWRHFHISSISPSTTVQATAERDALTHRMPELDVTAQRLQQAVAQLSAERAATATLQACMRCHRNRCFIGPCSPCFIDWKCAAKHCWQAPFPAALPQCMGTAL